MDCAVHISTLWLGELHAVSGNAPAANGLAVDKGFAGFGLVGSCFQLPLKLSFSSSPCTYGWLSISAFNINAL